ncbi:MAG: pyridoxine 5'-phosphate synthase [Parabacteroides merdae]
MTNLSVNINKVATIRNARGGNVPNVLKVALDCETFGAQGITVHPRPDERHIRYSDVYALKPEIKTEFNIEGLSLREVYRPGSESKTDAGDTSAGCSR